MNLSILENVFLRSADQAKFPLFSVSLAVLNGLKKLILFKNGLKVFNLYCKKGLGHYVKRINMLLKKRRSYYVLKERLFFARTRIC